MPFQSKFKFNDKLNRCLVNDADHIGLSTFPVADRRGDHVLLIQEALNAFARRTGWNEILLNGIYDQTTADFVETYKRQQTPPLLNFQGQIDNIVGKRTVDALDKELPSADIAPLIPSVDIIIKFQGALQSTATTLTPNEVFPDLLLGTYNQNRVNEPIRTRKLIRIGQTTNTIPPDQISTDLIASYVAQIKQELTNNNQGKIFIYGSSSGGRNALDLAQSLTAQDIPIALIATQDAAWFPQDALNSTGGSIISAPPNIPIPQFRTPGTISAEKIIDYFQTIGNRTEPSFSQGKRIFSSNMANKEIHGNVNSFSIKDLTLEVKTENPNTDDNAHIALIRISRNYLHQEIKLILDGL
jgi:hypothetical protein